MKWIKNKPLSFYIFGFTTAVFLLQVLPYPGIFLMLLMAPFWSIITINAAFASLAFEAYFGIVSRKWMLAPIAWFGGYFAVALLNHLTFYQLSNEMVQFNAGKSIPFLANTTALVVDKNAAHFTYAPDAFVNFYDLPVVYETAKGNHLAYRAKSTDKICDRKRADMGLRALGLRSLNYNEDRNYLMYLCSNKYKEDPKLPTVTATATTKKHESWWFSYTVDTIIVRAASGEAIELKSGYASTMSWWPQPVLGCSLIDNPSSWRCTLQFWKGKDQGLGAEGDEGEASVRIIAKALNLKLFDANTKRDTNQANLEHQKAIAEEVSRSIANLDELITNPTKKVTSRDLAGLSTRLDILGQRAEGMTVALFRAIDGDLTLWENSLNLQRLIALLKPEDFNRIGTKLLAEFEARPDLPNQVYSVELLQRLGDLGPMSSEILAKVAFSDKDSRSAAALLGICKMGTPAAKLASNIEIILASTKRSDERHSAAYVALLRIGREDLADNDPDAKSSYSAAAYSQLRQLTNSERTEKFCVRSTNWIWLTKTQSPTP